MKVISCVSWEQVKMKKLQISDRNITLEADSYMYGTYG